MTEAEKQAYRERFKQGLADLRKLKEMFEPDFERRLTEIRQRCDVPS
jgi:hypothetical protein